MRTDCPAAAVAVALACGASAGQLSVVDVDPPRHHVGALVGSSITVTFDQPVDPATVGPASFWAFGRWSGPASGDYVFSAGGAAVTLQPETPLFPGEQVLVIVSREVRSAAGDPLRPGGYSWRFWTAAAPAPRSFATLDTLSTRTVPTVSTRAYGGIASDLDGDGWADLTIVNEDTADLRVFMNLADGTGLFDDFIEPTFPVNDRASPSEPADFNRDGAVDICVANINADTVSILLGAGDGQYGPQQEIAVGSAPRGIAVLDADGDGDLDIANTNADSSSVSLLLNDGDGAFGPPEFFEGGGFGEWALAAADMNDDGLLDLVVGARFSQTVVINAAEGDGTFTPGTPHSAGGSVWMLVTGDVDGDGAEDVATANSSSNNGAILLGDGAGGLGAPQTHVTDPFPLATDLGDLDGDGDLDWVTSSFNGDWWIFVNDGSGTFAFDQERPAPAAASCSLAADLDNDGDLDLALVDEIADVVVLELNGGTAVAGDLDGDGQVGTPDFLELLALWGPCPAPCPPLCPGDLDFDCTVGVTDFLLLLANWGVPLRGTEQ